MPKGTYGIGGFCIVDGQPISQDRLSRGSVTCSQECYKTRRKAQRSQQDSKECRYCRKPSSFEEREAYKRFKSIQKKHPELLYPKEYEEFKAKCDGEEVTTDQFLEYLSLGANEARVEMVVGDQGPEAAVEGEATAE